MSLEEVVCELTAQTALAFPIGLVSEGRILNDVAHPPLWESAQSRVAERGQLWGSFKVEWGRDLEGCKPRTLRAKYHFWLTIRRIMRFSAPLKSRDIVVGW
jgi:hypothetical protein